MEHTAASYTEQLQQVRWNLIVFLSVFVFAAILCAFTGGWDVYLLAFMGWGMVMLGQLFYVFIIERWRVGSEAEEQSVQTLAS